VSSEVLSILAMMFWRFSYTSKCKEICTLQALLGVFLSTPAGASTATGNNK